MFVQMIEGKVADREQLRQQMDRWMDELRSGASGWLGATGGVTEDGTAVIFARFESASAAQANSERPEQGAWWAETEKCFTGPVTFADCDDVETLGGGGSNHAGFVQILKSSGVDRQRLTELDKTFESIGPAFRPDLIGGMRLWTGPDSTVEAAYFTSEAEAREGEQKPPPPELAEAMAEFESMTADTTFLDLHHPWLY